MVSVILTAFLSFNLINSTVNEVTSTNYKPEINVQLGSFEVNWWCEGIIGRHQMVSYDSVDYLGPISIKKLSNTYSTSALKNFHFEETIQTTNENSISLTISESSKFTSTLGVKAGLNDIQISDDYSINKYFYIEGVSTYTITNEIAYEVEYDVDQKLVLGKKFYLAEAAYVYKINCQKWQYDNYWWGNYEVDNSRSSFVSYVSLSPFITIALEDGTLL